MSSDAETVESTQLDALSEAIDEVFAAQRRLRGRDAKEIGGISFAQSRVLNALVHDGEMPVGQLATAVGVSTPSITQMLDNLERRGLTERTRSTSDRRVVSARATPEGQRRMRMRRAEQRESFRESFRGLDEDELAAGIETIRRLAQFLDAQ